MLRRITRLIAGVLAAGLLLALAPSASAAATYDITQVGDADWVGVTDANGRELSGQTTASDGLQVTATVRLRIDDIGALREGDTVLVKATAASGSHFGPSLFSRTTLPPSLLDRRGNAVFTVSNAYGDDSVLKLTRTGTTALGSYSCDLAATNKLWRRTPESKTSTWRIGSSSAYTFASRPLANTPCASNSNGEWVPQVQGNSISVNQWFLNCGTMRSIMDGPDTSGIRTESQVGWARIIPESGRITSLGVPNNSAFFILKAVDGRTPGSLDVRKGIFRLSWKSDVDISTYDKAVANLPVGSVAVMEREDGSWDIAYNIGSRLPGLANSLKTPDSSDPATLELQRNTGNIWQVAQTTFYVRFQDESVPNRVSVETRGTEYAYRSRTLTTKPLDPAIGQGQSAIRYDPNGGKGDAFKKVGDPGTTATTAEAGVFLRKGHTFAGWNTKADGTGTAYQAGADVAYPAEGQTLTLYAQWKRVPETTMPDTGGTMNHRRLTTMLGGACPHGPSVRPHAPAQAGLSHARRVMGHAEAHHPQTGHPCRSGRPAVRTRPVHARGAHRPRRRGIAAGDIHGIGQVVGARPETVRGREARTVGFIRPAGPVGRRAVGRVGVGHGGHLPVLRHFRHAADGHAGRRDVGHAAHGRERARLAVVPVRRLHQVRVV
ncbi:InlB B-repeat-containing protein [Bifidobacterium adolescentis]|uniref:InlB B-repeat-containing protein n=1 Tax=Bifidobacterium adolescentis TaxID=1680 RepID=UPI0034A3324B